MKCLSFITFIILALLSCSKEIGTNVSHSDDSVIPEIASVSDGILCFSSADELNSVVNSLKERNSFDLKHHPITKSTTDFVSLRQSLIEQGLREFTDDELAIIQQEGLTYEPEDSLIADPYLCTIYVIYPQGEEVAFNKGREVVKWDGDWFYGRYIIGFSIGLDNPSFGLSNFTFKSASEINLGRACIYAAVKYDNKWRGCVIKTE